MLDRITLAAMAVVILLLAMALFGREVGEAAEHLYCLVEPEKPYCSEEILPR